MSKVTLTDGTEIIYFYDNCGCGLTGGCEKCKPFIYTPEMQQEDIQMAEEGIEEYYKIISEEDIKIPLSPDLIEFYKKRGYKIND